MCSGDGVKVRFASPNVATIALGAGQPWASTGGSVLRWRLARDRVASCVVFRRKSTRGRAWTLVTTRPGDEAHAALADLCCVIVISEG